MTNQKKWKLKDKFGRVHGPLVTQQIFDLIEKGYLSGDEELSPQEEERWTKIIKYPEFYDELIEALNKPQTQFNEDDFVSEVSRSISLYDKKENTEEKKEAPKRGRAVEYKEKKPVSVESKKNNVEKLESQELPKEEEVISLTDTDISYTKKKKPNYFILFFIGLAAVFVILYFLEEEVSTVPSSGVISLSFPEGGSASLSLEEQRGLLQLALSKFEQDSFSSYFQAQGILVKLLSSNKKNTDGISLLCLTYRELWPYAKKDAADLQAVTKLIQLSQGESSYDVNSAQCRSMQALLISDTDAAESVVKSALEEFPSGAALYEMQAEVLANKKQFGLAIEYLRKTQNLWPRWIKPYYKEAEYRRKMNDSSGAVLVLKNILNKKSNHVKSQILIGIIEVESFNNPGGVDKILLGLSENEASANLQYEANKSLAKFFAATQKQKALEYAKKAYSLNPIDDEVRRLIISLGGETELSKVKSEDGQLVLLGDGYIKNKNYLAAQAQYKAAFDLNPKNSMAALKAAESLWKLNQTQDAITWVEKSIQSNPKNIEAYLRLSDYQSQRYDFKAAQDALIKAKDKSRINYQLLRAFALLELRRKNTPAAIKFSEQALKLYDSDTESLNILSRAYLMSGNYEAAFRNVAKSAQINKQNPETHEIYGLSLLGYRGFLTAQNYMQDLINTYPGNSDILYSYSVVLHKDERYGDAIDNLNKVTTIDASNYKAWLLLGDSYLKQNQLNDSLKSYFKAASLDPTSSEPIFNVGLIYLQSKPNISKSFKQFQKVIQTNPRYPMAHYYAGKAASEMGLSEQAINYVNIEKKLNPNIADPYILSAEIFTKQKNYAKAASELRNAVKLRQNDSNLYILLAQNYRLSGQLDAASSMLRVAQSKESGNAYIYREQGAVFEKLGLTEQAVSAYSKYIQLRPNAEDRSQIERQISNLGGSFNE